MAGSNSLQFIHSPYSSLEVQAESLARFAAISQQAGLVPIIEPDVDFAEDADLKKSVEVHVKIIGLIYARCAAYSVLLEGRSTRESECCTTKEAYNVCIRLVD